MQIMDRKASPPTGFALFNLGFRPFFLFAAVFAALAMALWGAALSAWVSLPFATVAWHGHEMLFGYAVAVMAGFLLTAARNWTGVRTPEGGLLAGMVLAWAIPRLVLPFAPSVVLPWLALADVGFDLALTLVLTRTLWSNPQNRWIFPPLLLMLTAGNLAWWLSLLGIWPLGHEYGLILGQGAALAVLLVMGVRVIPFFIEKRLHTAVVARIPVWLYRWGAALYGLMLLADMANFQVASAVLAAVFGLVVAWVLWRWYAPGLWREPLLWMLWLAGVWLVLGLGMKAVGDPLGLARHALLAGALGLATLGMMARVTLGHSGRTVYPAPRFTTLAFAMLILGAVLRVVPPLLWPGMVVWTMPLAAFAWLVAFGIFVAMYAPMLWQPRVDGKPG